MGKVSYQSRSTDKNIAQANQPASQQSRTFQPNPLQQLANQSRQVSQLKSYQQMADRSQQSGGKSTSQPVVQRAAKYQVENLIGFAVSPAADAKKIIVDDLTAKTGGKPVGHAESGGTPWVQVKDEVRDAALEIGYKEEAATRLVEKNPYTKQDIKGKSTMEGSGTGQIVSFDNLVKHDVNPNNHQLYFYNKYLNGNWTMGDNFRNPYLASFFGNELVEEQKEVALSKNVNPGVLNTITRANIVSRSGVKWARDNKIQNGVLSAEHFQSFLKTENGQHSMQMAKQNGKHLIGGEVTKMNDSAEFFDVKLITAPKFTRGRSASVNPGRY